MYYSIQSYMHAGDSTAATNMLDYGGARKFI